MWEFKKQNKRAKEKTERERERAKPRNRFLTIENMLMVSRGEAGEGWVKQVVEIKECTCPVSTG